MKNTQLLLIFTVMIAVLAFLTVTGCDEGMNMVSPVITEPSEEPMTPEGPITTNGEMKKPDEGVDPGSEQLEPTPEPDPEKPETPVEEPKPTMTIGTVVQADDTSVTISGTSTNVPEGAKVTIVLGDGIITVKAVVDKDGAWSTTVPAKKTARLSPGTITVKATAKRMIAKSSFEIAPPPAPEPHKNDFVGQVNQWLVTKDDREVPYLYSGPVAGVTLTVISGERAGEQSVTDENGQYRFSDPARETTQLHLRVEKEGREPKKVIVHRSQPTETLGSGIRFSVAAHQERPQETPGTILIGHRWPDKVRFILEETMLPHDLTLVIVNKLPKNYGGFYWGGVVIAENKNCLLFTISHELAHAHQHAVAVIEGKPTASVGNWEDTPSGKAYLKAQAKDWEEGRKLRLYDKGRRLTLLYENMAEVAKEFWNMLGEFDNPLCFSTTKLAEEAPNRFRWAQEWLSKKYE